MGASAALLPPTLYLYGGLHEVGVHEYISETSGDLYALELETLSWIRLEPGGAAPPPAEKGVGWSHGGDVYFMGGFTDRVEEGEEGRWDVSREPFSNRGWTNFLGKN